MTIELIPLEKSPERIARLNRVVGFVMGRLGVTYDWLARLVDTLENDEEQLRVIWRKTPDQSLMDAFHDAWDAHNELRDNVDHLIPR